MERLPAMLNAVASVAMSLPLRGSFSPRLVWQADKVTSDTFFSSSA